MNYIVSVPLNPKLAETIGKKGSENSITFYNRKLENDVIVALGPTSIMDKFYAVAEAMLLSSQIIVSTADLDKLFGEILVACTVLDKHVIFTKDSEINQYLKGADFDYEILEGDAVQKILERKPKYDESETRIDIDKAFPVKGLGTVILGVVTKGTLNVHQELYHSSGKKITVKSIQSQDVDMQEVGSGTRVGIVPKGIEHEEIEKGDLLLSSKSIPRAKKAKIMIKMNKIAPENLQK